MILLFIQFLVVRACETRGRTVVVLPTVLFPLWYASYFQFFIATPRRCDILLQRLGVAIFLQIQKHHMGRRRTEPARRGTATGFGTIPRSSDPYIDA